MIGHTGIVDHSVDLSVPEAGWSQVLVMLLSLVVVVASYETGVIKR